MITCIVTDMDGTLLNEEHVVSNENKQAILDAQKRGLTVIVATGRSYPEAKYVLEDAGIECPMICANGAEVRTSNGDIIATNPINLQSALDVHKVFQENDLYYELYTNKGTFSDDYDRALTIIMDIFMSSSLKGNYEKSLAAAKERFSKGLVHLVKDFQELFQDPIISINKFIGFSYQEERLQQVKTQLQKISGIAVSSSGKENIEVNAHNAQKGVALTAFAKENGIQLGQVMAIGDNYNDLSMFKVVGRAVAMGNAPDEIKKHCGYQTDTNERHGVAKAVNEVLLFKNVDN